MSERASRRKFGGLIGAAAGMAVVASTQIPPAESHAGGSGSSTQSGASLEQQAEAAVKARLICDSTSLVPGRKVQFALAFDLAPGWHLYWRNPGDSGLPISFTFRTPSGVKIGRVHWPTPARHLAPGDVLDYIYEKQVTLVFDAETSHDAMAGQTLTIEADISWLVCKEACVPGERTVKLSVPIAFESTASPESKRFAEARTRVPKPASASSPPPFTTSWNGLELVVRAPEADELIFYPLESEQAVPVGLAQRGAAKGTSLTIPYTVDVRGADKVRAVVELRRNGAVTYHELEVSPPPS